MTTQVPHGSALPMDPRILQDSLARLRRTAVTPGSAAPALVIRAAPAQFRRPVPAPQLRAVHGARATRPVLVPTNLAALAGRLHRAADPETDVGS